MAAKLTLPGGALAGARKPLALPAAAMRGGYRADGDTNAPAHAGYPRAFSGDSMVSTPEAKILLGSARPVMRKRMFLSNEGQKLSDVYEVEEEVMGQGGFGTVYKARLREAPAVVRAVKKVWKRNLKAVDFVRREIAILRRLDHPAICRLLETFEDDKAIYLVMELIDGRELFDEIVEQSPDKLDERQASNIMRQVFTALQYCHARAVMHRDLKPDNIMVSARGSSQSEVKIIDFGLAVMSSRPLKRSISSAVGTADYQAPEARAGTHMPVSDVWSTGMVLHALLVGCLPTSDVLFGEDALHLSAPRYQRLSQPARDLLWRLLQPDPARRMTAAEASAHPWVCKGPSEAVIPALHDCGATMNAFSAFQRSAKIRRAALTVLAMQLTSQQLRGLREEFLAMDTDGNGRLSKEELSRSIALAAPGGALGDVKDWVDSVFDSIDTDGSQEIEYTEWLAAALNVGALRSEEALRAAFRVFDLDGDGGIDQRELGHVLSQTPEEIAVLLPQFDADGDGRIDFEEFCAVFNDPRVSPSRPAVSCGGRVLHL